MKALNLKDRKEIFVLDALRFSLRAERRAHATMQRQLRRIERTAPRTTETAAFNVLVGAWLIVDSVHRARRLFGQVRGLSHRVPQYTEFLGVTKAVEDFRNFFQHIDSSIAKLRASSYPILGTVSWVSRIGAPPARVMSYTLSIGHWAKDTHSHSLVVDTQTSQFVTQLQLNAGTASLNLSACHTATTKASRFLESWLRRTGRLSDKNTGPSLIGFGIAL